MLGQTMSVGVEDAREEWIDHKTESARGAVSYQEKRPKKMNDETPKLFSKNEERKAETLCDECAEEER